MIFFKYVAIRVFFASLKRLRLGLGRILSTVLPFEDQFANCYVLRRRIARNVYESIAGYCSATSFGAMMIPLQDGGVRLYGCLGCKHGALKSYQR